MRRFRSIQNSMILTFTILLLTTIILLGTLSFYLFGRVIKENAEISTTQLVTQLNNVIDTYIAYMIDIANVAGDNEGIQELLDTPETAKTQINYINLKDNISSFFNSLLTIRNDISSIALILNNGEAITDSPDKLINPAIDMTQPEWLIHASEKPDEIYLSPGHVQNLIKDEYPWVITLSKSIINKRTGEYAGTLMVDLNYELIEEICEEVELGNQGYVFVINETGEIVYHPRQQLIYSDLKTELIDSVLTLKNGNLFLTLDNEDVLYTVHTSNNTGWTLVGVSYIVDMNSYKNQLRTIYILLGILGFSLLILLSILLSSRISRPIEKLRESMKEVEHGNFNIEIAVDSTNEIQELAQDCKIAIKKIKELMDQNERDQDIKRKNELKALQAQINPHFLYNTLDSIIWMAECGQTEEVVDMTTALAEFFRLGITKGSEIVSVRSMMDHIRNYLTIQKMRYKNKLDYRIDVDPDIYSYRTLKLLIQPIVENSIYHGLKEKKSGGWIKISGRKEGNLLIFEIEDNGVGISVDSFEDLLENSAQSKTGSGVGLRNVQERIKLFFGDEFGLTYKSIPGKGTIFTLTLPPLEQES